VLYSWSGRVTNFSSCSLEISPEESDAFMELPSSENPHLTKHDGAGIRNAS
jgi:hypothetical protein